MTGGWYWEHVERIHLLWLAIAAVAILFVLELERRNALAAFLSPTMQRRLTAKASFARTATRLGLVLGSMVFAVLALMQPRDREDTDTVTTSLLTADVMFVLDTSRSMLAEDTAPNRLARAKAEIGQLVDRLDGHRVGLIAFAGRAASVCPLTPDHSFFHTALSTVDTRSAGRGGTRIGEAIKVALRGFPSGFGAKLIVLISDGDDQDAYSEEAARLARDAGARIIAVGLGSEAGSTITLTDPDTHAKTTLMHDHKPVISKLNGDQLRKVATITEGAYIPAGTSAVDLDSIMASHIGPILREAAAASKRTIPAEKYPRFVLAALGFLLAALWVGASPSDRRSS